jgi:exopolysaccharide biosynthesis polyprenyl glycosylphosphotransferase
VRNEIAMTDTRIQEPPLLGQLATPDAPPRRPLLPFGLRWMHLADIVVLQVVLWGSLLVRFGTSWPKAVSTYATTFAIATAIHMVIHYFGGLYEPVKRLGARMWLPRVSALTFAAVLVDAAVALLTGTYLVPRFNLALLLVFGSLGITFNRWLALRLRNRRYGAPRVLLVGNPDDIHLARAHLQASEPHVRIAGQVADVDRLAEAIERVHATDALLLSGNTLDAIYPHPLEELEQRRIGVFQRISPSDTLLGLQRTRQIAGMPFVSLRAHALPSNQAHFKRITELVYLLVLAPVLIVLIALTAAYVRLRAGRGIIHRQQRVGRFGTVFTLYKFRTMVVDAELMTGAVKAEAADPRIVPGLAWVRRARLDELPQFLNVLRGEMSFVGPRPERPEFAEQYEMIIPGYGRRHDIPPGITGLAQVHGNYHTDPGYKLGHDLQYLVNWSPILDLQIILRTVWTVLAGRL